MLRNNLKMMLRNMRKHSMHSIINVVGLSVGLCCFIVISLYVSHEFSFDKMFTRSASTYRITMSSVVGGTSNHIPTVYPAIAPVLADRFPSIGTYTRIYNFKYSRLEPTFRYGDKVHYEQKVIFGDSTFFKVFDFKFASGDPAKALQHPKSVVITESIAKKYFGGEDAMGKILSFNGRVDLQVSGVLKDIPSTTHVQFDFLVPLSYFTTSGNPKMLESWDMDWFWTYLTINDPSQVAVVEAGINDLASEKIKERKQESDVRFFLQPLEKVHLYSKFDYNTDLVQNGDVGNLYIFISVGVLVLLISAINFINISMAIASGRFKEIGISKVLGAMKSQLRWQFLLEAIVICLGSLAIAFGLVKLSLPLFSSLLDAPLYVDIDRDVWLLAGIVLFTILTGLVSGIFPAMFISSLEPQRVLKGIWKQGQGGAKFRKALVGMQIAIAIFLVIGTVVIFEQLRYIQDRPLGYEKDHVVLLTVRDTKVVKSYHAFKNSLLNETSIRNVSSVSEPIGREVQFMTFDVEGHDKPQFVKILNVTHDFVNTMGLEIVKGRDYSREVSTDSVAGFIINEAAAKTFGWSEPVGKAIDHSFRKVKEGRVIGVVKDFNFEPLQRQIDPIVIWFGGPYWYVAVNVQPGKTPEALAAMEREWRKIEPDKPFAFQFLDQAIQHVYDKEQRLANVFLVFSILSIATAVIGLYGLISFIAGQRSSEIGIRKVLGASVRSILYLMTKEYFGLMAIAFVISAPLTWLIISQWLESFAFRIDWNMLYFVCGLAVTSAIVLSTVAFKSLGAARVNPVDVIRSE
ncbi:MAG TPA: ABC transporter permease [Cyclobacteriaceae bacterium]|nr:ABC transporter permease [Cyclobacteriaceae bacterium]